MLREPTFEKLHRLRLLGMAEAFEQQLNQPDLASLSFEERFGLLVDAQWTWKENKALVSRLKKARLTSTACFEDINFRHPRNLDRGLIRSLGDCQWVSRHQNILITGSTGIGKSYLCRALLHKACREGYTAYYSRASRFFRDLEVAYADGSFDRFLTRLAKTDVLAIDDWGLAPLTDQQCRHLLEVLDDRYGCRSTLLTSQYKVKQWHDQIGFPTLADAILDRIVHNAYKLELEGESIRREKAQEERESSSTAPLPEPQPRPRKGARS